MMEISHAQRADLRGLVGAWCRANCEAGTVAEIEELAGQLARAVGASVVEAMLPELAGQATYEGCHRPCSCGGKAKFVDYRARDVSTLYGVVRVKRAYYHCKQCHTGQLPWDEQQGLDRRVWTPRVKALVTEVAARLSYQEAVDLIEKLSGFRMEDSSADEVVTEVGARLRSAQTAQVAEYERGELALQVDCAPRRLYVGLDGTSAHVDGAWHEVKTGVVYEAQVGEDGVDRACGQQYVAAQEPSEAFGSRLYLLAAQAGVEQAEEVVVIGDGAEWIWNVARHHYPQARQILDYFHACEHIHDLARAYYGEGSAQGKCWAQGHCRSLKRFGPGKLVGALKRMKPPRPEQAEAVRRERAYFERNRGRMEYQKFRAWGLMIGSGPVEAACKVVVGQRLKRAGMRWSASGADAVLAARAALLSGQEHLIDEAARAA